MLILTKYPEKYKDIDKNLNEVVDYRVLYNGADRIAAEQHLHSFRSLSNTVSGPCVIVGMGSSRLTMAGKKCKYPILAINRAIMDFPDAQYWAAHDIDSLLDCHVDTKAKTLTLATNVRKPGWDRVSHLNVFFIDIFPDPRRHKKAPLYWNQTTFGWLVDLAIRMGYGPIYVLGVDRSIGSYINPHFSDIELKAQHIGVQERILEMFQPEWLGAWNSRGAEIIDLADDGYLPVRKGKLEEIIC